MTPDVLFYDGACGLCHLSVRLLLGLDRNGALRFAPLGGETFRALVGDAELRTLPDSLVLRTTDGRLLVRSAAVLESLRRAGGFARGLAAIAGAVPSGLADRLYDLVARRRRRWFAATPSACPVVGGSHRSRLLP
ncbi:MAG TPA: DCC1-like thiol-disulfide oxidoreductase family protein [Vicinamibacteria bacterium]